MRAYKWRLHKVIRKRGLMDTANEYTIQGYRSAVRNWLGLTPCKPSSGGHTVHMTRDGHYVSVADPEGMSPQERAAFLEVLRFSLGITDDS